MKNPVNVGMGIGLFLGFMLAAELRLKGDPIIVTIVATGFACAGLAKVLQGSLRGSSSGFWHSVPGRWLIGRMAGLAVILLLLWPVRYALNAFFAEMILRTYAREGAASARKLAEIYASWGWPIAIGIAWELRTRAKVFIGKSTRPVRRWGRSFRMGGGGSSGFASILEEWANRWKPGMIFLGHSLHDRRWPVGVKDDRMLMTIAGNGGGKGETAIIPNLLTYPGSVFINDTKGQNAAVTANARRVLGQDVFVLAPFAEETAHLNPLAGLDPDAPDYIEQIKGISEALVIAGEGKDRVWSEWAKIVIEGLIDLEIRYHEEEAVDEQS